LCTAAAAAVALAVVAASALAVPSTPRERPEASPGDARPPVLSAASVIALKRSQLAAIRSARPNPLQAARTLATADVAVLRAVARPAAGSPGAARHAARAAVDTVVGRMLPGASTASAPPVAEGRPVAAHAGAEAAADLLAERAALDGDGDAAPARVRPRGPGRWRPTPPAYAPPLEPAAGDRPTWLLRSGREVQPPPPPAAGGDEHAREVRRVHRVVETLTPAQRRVARRWSGGPGTVTPAGLWNEIALDLASEHRMPGPPLARLLALLNAAQEDAFTAAWAAKYAHWRERPVTAVRRLLQRGWLPLIETPPFPSYVSGHAAVSGAASVVLAGAFPGRAAYLRRLAVEAAHSRVLGGIHFPSDDAAGLRLGRRVGALALERRGRVLDEG